MKFNLITTSALQHQIINLLPRVENKKILKAIQTILEQEAKPVNLTQEQMDEIDRREEAYLKGEGKSYTWEEIKFKTRNKEKFV